MQSDYLTTEKPLKALFLFSIPMIIGGIFQQAYTMVDSAVAGRYISEQALAAIGASYALTNVFVWFAIGGGIGAAVIVGRYFGAKDFSQMKTAISTALISFLVISIILGIIGLIFSKKIMILLNTPENVLEIADVYLKIFFVGLPFIFMYNILSFMFNAMGKSKIPLYFLIFSSLLNIVLDLVFVIIFNMNIAGVAWATCIAQGISAVLSFIVLLHDLNKYSDKRNSAFSQIEMVSITKIAAPSILQQMTVSIGMLLVQSVVNGFGFEVLAGFSAAMRVESMCVVPMVSIGNAISPYTAQNIGASKNERVPKGLKSSLIMIVFWALLFIGILELFNKTIIVSFLGKQGSSIALETGIAYLKFIGFFFIFIGIKMAVDGVLRGAGDMKAFTFANIANLCIRVFLSISLAPQIGVWIVWGAEPVGWIVNFAISFAQYRTGKWKTIYKK